MRKVQELDDLTKDVLAAEAAGMSYGKWKALHPRTHAVAEEAPVKPVKKERKPPEGSWHECISCGTRYWANLPGQRYCSERCRDREAKRRYMEKKREDAENRKCQFCGNPLSGKMRKFCSHFCCDQAYRMRKRALDTGKAGA